MATIAFDEPNVREAARPPISLHPAFPAIVALWFAALLGLGSLVLPVVLLERAVEASGIASIVPAASPPLGFTARGILAIAAAFGGAAIGAAIARRVARAHRPQLGSRIAKLSGGSPRPISIKDEIGGQGVVNGESLPINRRRALAISEDDRPSDFLYQAPLPGDGPEAPIAFLEEPAPVLAGDPEPLELSDLAAEAPEPAASDLHDHADDEDIAMTARREFQPASSAELCDAPGRELAEKDESGERHLSAAPRGPEPLPFSPPSLARRPIEPEPEPEPEPALRAESDSPLAAVEGLAASPEAAFRADWETAPLDGLGLVQLVQRLGSTIERRREFVAQAAPLSHAAPSVCAPADIEAAPAEEAAQAMAAYFGSAATANESVAEETGAPQPQEAPSPADPGESIPAAMARPDFLQPFTAEDADEGDAAIPDFSLPLRRAAPAPSVASADSEVSEEEEEEADDGYSSLLGLSNPFGAPKGEFVRIEEPEAAPGLDEPAVVFPGQEKSAPRMFDPPGSAAGRGTPAAPAPVNTDAALRAALATLQRMSGAA